MKEASDANSVNEEKDTGRLSLGVIQESRVLFPMPLIPVMAYTSGVKGISILKWLIPFTFRISTDKILFIIFLTLSTEH